MSTARKNAEPGASEDWVSLPEAARLLGLHRQKVLSIALAGALQTDIRGKWTFVTRSSIERYLASATAAVTE